MRKILIIEDDRILMASVCDFLKEEAYEVLQARNGNEGIELAKKMLPDLILCDIFMPKRNGYEVFEILKEDLATSLIPFIFMTAKADKEDILYGMKLGADDYIVKPIDFLELKSRINQRLEKTKNTIRQSEVKYRALFELANDAIFMIRIPDWNIVDVNISACHLLGYPKEELLTMPGNRIFETAICELITTRERSSGEKETDNLAETFLEHKTGKKIPVQISTKEISLFNESLVFIIVRDISEIKSKEQALLKSEKRFREISELTSDWIWEIDPEWKFTYVSSKVTSILGFTPEEMIGCSIFDFVPSEKVDEMQQALREQVHQYKPLTNIENKVRHKNGQVVYLESSGIPVFDNTGTYLGYRGADRDITLRRTFEDQLILAKEKAEESDRIKSSILSNMSHELRTPLNGILGFSEILKEELKDSEYNSMIQNIYISGKRLMTTLNSIITLSQLEGGKVKINEKEVELIQAIKKVIKSFESQAAEKNIRLVMDLEDQRLILTDELLLKQLLRQILDNAIKFTTHGSISIKTECITEDTTNWFVVKVIDTGIGISTQNYDLIYQEFRQVSEGFDRKYQGSGLGLTISKKISELLNAKIFIESEPEKGSTFSIWLPDKKLISGEHTTPDSEKVTEKSGSSQTGNIKPTVLLVEDNIVNKELTEFYLRPISMMDYAIDGKEAIQLAKTNQYALILMDINLGSGMDGIEAIKYIRQIPGYQNTPIIAVTGYTMIGDREKLLEHGCTHYIAKPFEKETLISMVRQALENKQG